MSRTISVVAAFVASVLATNANSPHDFWRTNSPISIKLEKSQPRADRSDVRERIMQANVLASQRHGVPFDVMHKLTTQESGYRFVRGPMTRWGRAHGPHQILCSTAATLGENDCQRLMHDAVRSADLSAKYLRQGFIATGSWAGAAAYYHGGPNTRLWGPKTQAYARTVGGGLAPVRYAVNRDPSAPIPTKLEFGSSIVPSSTFRKEKFVVASR